MEWALFSNGDAKLMALLELWQESRGFISCCDGDLWAFLSCMKEFKPPLEF